MSKFKVGDKVRFISDAEASEGLGRDYYPKYEKLASKTLTVASVQSQGRYVSFVELANGDPDECGAFTSRLRPVRTRKVVTKQGIFDFVYRFLVRQGRPARGWNGCAYRLEMDGEVLCCAAGCLLSDKEACRFADNMSWRWNKPPARFAGHEDFIVELQNIHDAHFKAKLGVAMSGLDNWKNHMHAFAALHGLTVPSDV